MEENCYYGCGEKAKYITSNGRSCCTEKYKKCPGYRSKMSIACNGNYKNLKNVDSHIRDISCIKCKKCFHSVNGFIIHAKKCYKAIKEINCECCGKIHDGSYGSGRFCTQKCSRSYSTKDKRDEINFKKSITVRMKFYGIEREKIDTAEVIKRLQENKLPKKSDIKTGNFEDFTLSKKYETVFAEQNNSCNKCKLTHWLGQLITLEMEHIDGNNKNNKRKNLELLCPNCHSQTDTWRGRNKKKKPSRVTDENMIIALLSFSSIRQALISLGLSAKGNNYLRAKRLLKIGKSNS
jgi:hypothetical protein